MVSLLTIFLEIFACESLTEEDELKTSEVTECFFVYIPDITTMAAIPEIEKAELPILSKFRSAQFYDTEWCATFSLVEILNNSFIGDNRTVLVRFFSWNCVSRQFVPATTAFTWVILASVAGTTQWKGSFNRSKWLTNYTIRLFCTVSLPRIHLASSSPQCLHAGFQQKLICPKCRNISSTTSASIRATVWADNTFLFVIA